MCPKLFPEDCLIIITAWFVPEGGKGNYFSGWDRLITGSQVRSVLIFKDQLHQIMCTSYISLILKIKHMHRSCSILF